MDDLEERLQSHARAFQGLMSLIPAQHYYTQDNTDQWSRKKKSKEEKRAAKRAKLDPDTYKSAKDVMDENERKRKRELGIEDDDPSDLEAPGKEKPREGMKPAQKKQKLDVAGGENNIESKKAKPEADSEAAEKKKVKAEIKAQKRLEKQEKLKNKANEKKQKTSEKLQPPKAQQDGDNLLGSSDNVGTESQIEAEDRGDGDEMDKIDVKGLVEAEESSVWSTASPSPDRGSPASVIPSNSSSSSIVTPTQPTASTSAALTKGPIDSSGDKAPQIKKVPKISSLNQDVLKARLQARIEQLRAARKADGLDGKPAKNKQELLDARRRKQELRKAHKKEMRKQAKDGDQRAAEAELARLRGSGSPLTGSDIFSQGIEKGKEMRQKKREEGLQKKREQKKREEDIRKKAEENAQKTKDENSQKKPEESDLTKKEENPQKKKERPGGQKGKGEKVVKRPKARPGFEGSFRGSFRAKAR